MASASHPLDTSHSPPVTFNGEDQIERTAFYFESQGQMLFAWEHRSTLRDLKHGIVICPPLGHEYVHTHRSLRHLADKLASEGFTVLRLDYHGTGDSAGAHDDPHCCETWQTNIHDAAEWLRHAGNCSKISLIGLRMGATLAALCTEQQAIENLVLWAPVVKGRRFVRELTVLNRTAKQEGESQPTSLEAVGFVYTNETLEALSKIDLTAHTPRFAKCLIVQSDNAPADSVLAEHFSKHGLVSEQQSLPGFDGMMAEPQSTVVPADALASITQWFVSHHTDGIVTESAVHPERTADRGSMKTLDAPAIRESVHRISSAPDLFGIISESTEGSDSLPWIALLNSGAAHRIGPGRLHVQLARDLSAQGYPCIRMDIGGLGDSPADPGREENDTYASTAFRDTALVCDYLQKLQPQRRIVLMGLCSGAYTAFQCAAQLPHPALIESIMLNPLTFFWRDGMSLNDSPTHRLRAWHYYRSLIFNPTSWQQLLTTKGSAGLKGAAKRLYQRMYPKIESAAVPVVVKPAVTGPYSAYGHPAKENLNADLKQVAAASRNLVLIVSETDPGHYLLMLKAKRMATQLIRTNRLKCFFINNADHTFSTESARAALRQTLGAHLQSRYGIPVKTDQTASVEVAQPAPSSSPVFCPAP